MRNLFLFFLYHKIKTTDSSVFAINKYYIVIAIVEILDLNECSIHLKYYYSIINTRISVGAYKYLIFILSTFFESFDYFLKLSR